MDKFIPNGTTPIARCEPISCIETSIKTYKEDQFWSQCLDEVQANLVIENEMSKLMMDKIILNEQYYNM